MTESGDASRTTFSVRLLIRSAEVPLDVVTATLGLRPTRSAVMHSTAGGRAPKANMWYLQAPRDYISIDQQWSWLHEKLAGKIDRFDDLSVECDIMLDLVVQGPRPAPEISIPGGMLEFAKDARCEFGIYFYDTSHGSEEERGLFDGLH